MSLYQEAQIENKVNHASLLNYPIRMYGYWLDIWIHVPLLLLNQVLISIVKIRQ